MGGDMIKHYFSSGVYSKEVKVPAQYVLVQHAHKHDHLSILAQGSVELVVDGVKSIINAPACVNIEAGKHHGIKTLSETVWYCIHATDCTDEDEIDAVLVQPVDTRVVDTLIQELVKEF